jgi:triacylglycerol esterase/lipase EstA (alpha/beta hydrolase family)
MRQVSTASSNATMPSVPTEDVAPRQEAVASLMGGPALGVGEDTLQRALSCPESFTHLHDPVLLVHGITQTSDENWAWNYAKLLPWQGFDVCAVALPDFGRADVQVQTEYVVHAIKAVAERSGGEIDVVAYSLGALPARAAIKWWPELRGVVDDLVMVAGTNHGTVHAHWQCATACIPSLWQLKPDSRFLAALNAGDETPGDISYTSVYSRTDLGVQPQLPGNATSEVAGASNMAVQDLCAVRVVDHPQTVSDAAVSAVVMDALTHPGPADPARIDRAVCLQVAAPGIDLRDALAYELTWWRDIALRSQEHKADVEPALAAWAVP